MSFPTGPLHAADVFQAATNVDEKEASPDSKLPSGKTSPGFFAVPRLQELLATRLLNSEGINAVRDFITADALPNHPLQPTVRKLEKKLAFLLDRIAHGDYAKVKKFLETNQKYLPCFLKSVGIATASSGQKMESTPLGMALCTEDVDYVDEQGRKTIEGMAQLIMEHLRRLPDGETLFAVQIKNQFPEGWQEADNKAHDANLRALHEIRTVIDNSTTDAECEGALQRFRTHLDAGLTTPITTGKQWDARMLAEAFRLREQYSVPAWERNRKKELFEVKVVGYIQRAAPDCIGQVFAYGIEDIVEGRWPLTLKRFKRFPDFRFDNEGRSYFPLLGGSELGLGYQYWADGYCTNWSDSCWQHVSVIHLGRRFSYLCTSKATSCRELLRAVQNEQSTRVAGDLAPTSRTP